MALRQPCENVAAFLGQQQQTPLNQRSIYGWPRRRRRRRRRRIKPGEINIPPEIN